jgi:lipoprotein signal peptidase
MNKVRYSLFALGGFFLFAIDRALKYLSIKYFLEQKTFLNLFGWHPFKNAGVAFGIPVPNFLTIFLTLCALTIIVYFIFYFYSKKLYGQSLAVFLIFLGAISNLLDRIFFSSILDYFLFFTSVINFADILIISGFVYFFFSNKKICL